ncbi:MAG: hypothetical protein E3J72_17085 [Planctomycetota bacterium]|nr:MAG: hypothetical protein E3J72_17085 [Planctomycetota bacterium]
MFKIPKKIGEILVEMNSLTRLDLEDFIRKERQPGVFFGDALVEAGFVSEEKVAEALAKQFELPYVNLNFEKVDPEAIKRIPEKTARAYHILPYKIEDRRLCVTVAFPESSRLLSKVRSAVQGSVSFAVASRNAISLALDLHYQGQRIEQRLRPHKQLRVYYKLFDPATGEYMEDLCSGRIVNLSSTGIAFIGPLTRRLLRLLKAKTGKYYLALAIEVPYAAQPARVVSEIRWVTDADTKPGEYRFGLRFMKFPHEDDKKLVGRLIAKLRYENLYKNRSKF